MFEYNAQEGDRLSAEALSAAIAQQEAQARAERDAQAAQATNMGRGVGWNPQAGDYSPIGNFVGGLLGKVGSFANDVYQLGEAQAARGSGSVDAFANAIGVSPGTVMGAMGPVPSGADIGLPNGQWGSMIPGSAPIMDASGFNPLNGPNLPQGGWGSLIPGATPIMDASGFHPLNGPNLPQSDDKKQGGSQGVLGTLGAFLAGVNPATVTNLDGTTGLTGSVDAFANATGVSPGVVMGAMGSVPTAAEMGLDSVFAQSAPEATGALAAVGNDFGGGGFPTGGDFSLGASDARMADVGGFHDPLGGGFVDMGGGPGIGGLLGGLFGGGGSDANSSVGEGTSGLW
jgi:hypothetical protein